MLKFTSINIDGERIDWQFESILELKSEFLKEDYDLPGHEDLIISFEMDGVELYVNDFEDILLLFGIEKYKYTWNALYDRAMGSACGDDELNAKDHARWILEGIIKDKTGLDINKCECPEDEIDSFIDSLHPFEPMFDKDGNLLYLPQILYNRMEVN